MVQDNYIDNVRDKRLFKRGSKKHSVTISDLTASATKLYGFEEDSTLKKYLPLNFLRIVNKGGTDLKVYINQSSDGEIILDDTIYTFNGNFYSFILENTDGSTTATGSNVYCTVQRQPTGG